MSTKLRGVLPGKPGLDARKLVDGVIGFNMAMGMFMRTIVEYNANARPDTAGQEGSWRHRRRTIRSALCLLRAGRSILAAMALIWPHPFINAQMRVGVREMAVSGPFSDAGCRSIFIQPASIGESSGGCLALETGSVFGISGLQDSGASLELALGAEREDSPWKGMAFGVSSVGFESYRSLSAIAGASVDLGGGAFGLSIRHVMQRFGGVYQDEHILEVDAGWVADLSDGLRAGIAIQQLAEWHPGQGLVSPPPRSPIGLEPGIAWSPNQWLRLTGSAGLRSGRSPQGLTWNASAEWFPHEQILFGFSRRSDPTLSVASLRIVIRKASFGFRSIIHPDLGMQHLAALGWDWER
jgi:hypothetical protein